MSPVVVEAKETREQVEKHISELIDNLLVLDQEQGESGYQGYLKLSRQHNVYHSVFTIVILKNMDSWECFPNLQFFWSE